MNTFQRIIALSTIMEDDGEDKLMDEICEEIINEMDRHHMEEMIFALLGLNKVIMEDYCKYHNLDPEEMRHEMALQSLEA